MTYEEALKAKEQIGDIITIRGVDHYVYVGPYSQSDFDLWKQFYYENNLSSQPIPFTDNLANRYSQNQQFKVFGNYQADIILSIKELVS